MEKILYYSKPLLLSIYCHVTLFFFSKSKWSPYHLKVKGRVKKVLHIFYKLGKGGSTTILKTQQSIKISTVKQNILS